MSLNAVLKKNLSILYSNDKMVEVFEKKKPMAAFRRPRNLVKGIVVRTKLKNSLPNVGFKICSDTRYLCANIALMQTDSFSSPITGRIYKLFVNTSCRTDRCIVESYLSYNALR